MPARVGFVWFPLRYPVCRLAGLCLDIAAYPVYRPVLVSAIFPVCRSGRVRLGVHPRFPLPREPDPLPTDPAAAEPSPAPPRPATLPSSEKRPSASESFFCQGQNNSHLPLATQKSSCQGRRNPSAPPAKQKPGCQGRKSTSVPLA